ncbi:maltokinase [Nocardioides ginsengisegetis]|uniref:Maltokinase n=1 Tax=Nocardioides ginsengisegetis TaxID=661491 RepID=A0A7W3IXZ5_9ACTN|nr:maltokinase [Nocardioides ginsengisegetis]
MTTTDQPQDLLTTFVAQARWFGGKGRDFSITGGRRLGEVPGHVADGPHVAIDLVTLSFEDGGADEYYQLPLAFYAEPQERIAHAHLGQWHDEDFGTCHVYDAVHDREAMACWLRSFADPPESGPLAFHRLPGHELDLETHSTLFAGEQSNSSVAFGDDSLMKVFRKITPGANPDISIHEVLTTAGSDHVAALYGWLDTPSLTTEGEPTDQVLQLAMLQQFLKTATDGWDLALASVRNLFAEADLHADEVGGDFAGESARLGEALAEVHASLAHHFPTEERSAAQVGALAAAMRDRLEAALLVVPGLAPHADRLRAAYDDLAALESVRVQRIHGDLHLGQTLRTVRGWKIVDFEGEPAKPLSERVLPDSPWRDVAGMLRSFDYAPRVVERTWGNTDDDNAPQRAYRAAEWAERNRTTFLEAYAGRELTADEHVLLAAYVADKAVYETVYEVRNRPSWVAIPLEAVARIGVS